MEARVILKLVWVFVALLFLPFGATSMSMELNNDQDIIKRTYYHDFIVKSTPCTRLCETTEILTVNEQFPGPTLHAHRGDTLFVNVHNQAKHNITIHWHGVTQLQNPWSDGAAYITQCPIQPGRNYTYNVEFSTEEGTLWWHAHSHTMRATVHGAIVVYPRHGTAYPFPKPHKEVPIILGEWWKMDVMKTYEEAAQFGGEPMHSDAYTINGQPGYLYPCSKPETFKILVEHGKTYLLRVVNAAMEEQLFFAVAGHRLTVVCIDGSYTAPFGTEYIMISPGQTMDLLVHADQPPARYAIAAGPFDNGMGSMDHTGPHMSPMDPMGPNNATTALFQYISLHKIHHSVSSPTMFPALPSYDDSNFANNFTRRIRSLRVRNRERRLLNDVDEKMFIVLSMNTVECETSTRWHCDGPMGMRELASMNNVSFVDPKSDVLNAYYHGVHGVYEEDFPSNPSKKFDYTGMRSSMDEGSAAELGTKVKVLEFGANVEIVFQATSLVMEESHPMHLHGHSFYVIGSGSGNFDPERDPLGYNLVDPPKQSTVGVPKGGWTTIRFKANNPGVWLLHCHFEHHHSKGMSMVFIVRNGPRRNSRLLHPPQSLPIC